MGKGPARIARVAYVLAPAFGCQPKTVAHWLDELPVLCGRLVQHLRLAGAHERADRFEAAIAKAHAETPAPLLTDDLILAKAEADAQDNVALDAYLLTRGAVERDTTIKRLRREATADTMLANALEAQG
jgi:hypothetical protein